MARIEWVRAKLDNWARWVLQRSLGGSGYPKCTPFAREMGASASTETSMIPIDDIDASRTHEVIESMRVAHSGLWLAVQCHYVGDPQVRAARRRPMSCSEIGRRMSIGERAVQRRLEDADAMIGARLSVMDATRRERQRVQSMVVR